MSGQRQNVLPTNEVPTKKEATEGKEAESKLLKKKNYILVKVYNVQESFEDEHTKKRKNTIHTDQTGKVPRVSSQGHKFQMVLYHVASNSIWVEAMKNQTEGKMILARDWALTIMKATGLVAVHQDQVLDNECFALHKKAITDLGMTYERVPPDNHRRHLAERAIQTWKAHSIAVLSGTATDFPIHL